MDSSAADHLIEPYEAFAAVKAATESGQIELLLPAMTRLELEATPDPAHRAKLIELAEFGTPILDGAFVFDVSRFNEARFGRDTIVEGMRDGNNRHSKDAAIAAAANLEGCALVTADEHQLDRAQKLMIWVWRPEHLLQRVGYQPGTP
jgi:predicted nucleic acid-binding protein